MLILRAKHTHTYTHAVTFLFSHSIQLKTVTVNPVSASIDPLTRPLREQIQFCYSLNMTKPNQLNTEDLCEITPPQMQIMNSVMEKTQEFTYDLMFLTV